MSCVHEWWFKVMSGWKKRFAGMALQQIQLLSFLPLWIFKKNGEVQYQYGLYTSICKNKNITQTMVACSKYVCRTSFYFSGFRMVWKPFDFPPPRNHANSLKIFVIRTAVLPCKTEQQKPSSNTKSIKRCRETITMVKNVSACWVRSPPRLVLSPMLVALVWALVRWPFWVNPPLPRPTRGLLWCLLAIRCPWLCSAWCCWPPLHFQTKDTRFCLVFCNWR